MKIRNIDLDIPYHVAANASSDALIVFLPSVRSKDIWPYFPRINWAENISSKCNVMYLSDPFQNMDYCREAGGSWFINPEGQLIIPRLADWMNDIVSDNGIKEILFYGSSLGGYASIIFGSFVPSSVVYAECPQIYLEKHPGSLTVMNNCQIPASRFEEFNPLNFIKRNNFIKELNIVVSVYDAHLMAHVIPFVTQLESLPCMNFDLNTIIYQRGRYKRGHVALDLQDSLKLLTMQKWMTV